MELMIFQQFLPGFYKKNSSLPQGYELAFPRFPFKLRYSYTLAQYA